MGSTLGLGVRFNVNRMTPAGDVSAVTQLFVFENCGRRGDHNIR